MAIEFKRGPDKGPRKTRSDKGERRKPFSRAKKSIKKRVNARQERVARRKKLADKKKTLEEKRLDLESQQISNDKFEENLRSAGNVAKVAGGIGTVAALSTKRGRKAVGNLAQKAGKVTGKGLAKGIEEGGKIAAKGALGVGQGFVEGGVEAGRAARKQFNEKVSEVAENAGQTIKQRASEDSQKVVNAGKNVVKKVKDDIETTKRAVQGQSKNPTPAAQSAPARSKGIKERLKEKAQRDKERRKKMFGFSEGENSETIEFAKKKKKKNVRVKSYRRKDGTVVRASTRKVDASYEPEVGASRRIGAALHNVGTGLIPIASAASTAAGAYGTILGAKDRHRVINRDLSALGESRKFLALGGSIGNLSRGVGAARLTRRKLADRERRTAIYEKSQDLFERKLGIEDRKEDRLGN